MNLFDVYPIYNIEPVKGENCYIIDKEGNKYLDFYGGNAVISIGHNHPYYINKITDQLQKISFYSNSVIISLQTELATKLGRISGYENYNLFLCNSGAEANENALKLASFHNGKHKVVSFKNAFHGRTDGTLAVTDNMIISAPINTREHVTFVSLNDITAVEDEIKKGDVTAVIIEGIQGLAGINCPDNNFLTELHSLCKKSGVVLILDEVQSGYGRTGKFFAHQYAGIEPDLITTAKGMGNGFPIAGVLINPEFKAQYGMLGTTFGGNHLACAAGIAVLDVFENESLVGNAYKIGNYFHECLANVEGINLIKGKGLMIGLEFTYPTGKLRNLLIEEKVFTGSSNNKNVLRILPPLTVNKSEVDLFISKLQKCLKKVEK